MASAEGGSNKPESGATVMLACGFVAGIGVTGLLNPIDRALYLRYAQ